MRGIDAPYTEHALTSHDGTRIAYFKIGRGARTWVIPPAMGAPLISYRYLFEAFQDAYTMVTWDMRGFYRSGLPADRDAVAIDDHVRDMVSVCEAESLERFVLGGWSMAVQVSLEYYHRYPDRVRALVLVNGPYERALDTALPVGNAARFLRPAIAMGRKASPAINRLSRAVLGARGTARALERVGILAANAEGFAVVMKEFSAIDWELYFRLMLRLHEHSAADYLREVSVPTLITAGTRDFMTPLRLAEHMHREIRGSELLVIPGGTHYTPTEYPAELVAGVTRFLRRVDPDAFAIGS